MQTDFISIYQTTIKAPVEKVWEALTHPDQVKQYFFGTELVTDWTVGSPVCFKGEYEGKAYQDKGIVQAFRTGETLSYSYLSSWSGMPDKPENYLLVTYQVREVPEGTELTITQSNYDEERAKHAMEGWKAVIEGMKKLVE